MAKEIVITLEIDEDLKNEAEKICNKEEISLATAFTLFIKKIVETREFPFEIKNIISENDPFYNEENQKKLAKMVDDVKSGKEKLTPHELIEDDEA